MIEFIESFFFGGANVLLAAAIILLVLVIGGAVVLVRRDIQRRPEESWVAVVKEWQPTLGAILGFLSAAGVLVISSELQVNQRAAESARAGQAIGFGLALEAEQLSNAVATMVTINHMIETQTAPDPVKVCRTYIALLKRVLPSRTIVYDAVLGNLVDFGDENLSVFVRFYSLYADLLQEARSYDTESCGVDGRGEIEYIGGKLWQILRVNGTISENYGTLSQDEILATANLSPPDLDEDEEPADDPQPAQAPAAETAPEPSDGADGDATQ